jgi:predicted metalloprotease
VLYLRIPAGHPSRGNGYSAGVGLLIDLNDMRGLREINDPDARSVAVLIVAHEVGHHVQALLANEGVQPSAATASVLEPQADCYAGWWIGYAMRDPSFSDTGPLFAAEDLNRRLARALQVLGLLERGGVTLRQEVAGDDPHGAVAQRVASIKKGLAASDPWRC